MVITLAFDVYGTLIDTNGVITKLKEIVDSKSYDFSRTWRDKQLEYSFRRGLMKKYENFTVCISNALDFTCAFYDVNISKEQKRELLDIYRILPVFSDVKEGLSSLKTAGFNIYAFSNGSEDTIDGLLTAASIRDFFIGIVSVDAQKTFKPNPIVYRSFLTETDSTQNCAWLISSNPFDVIGAISAGMKAVWLKRSQKAIFDPWDIQPTITASNFIDIKEKIEKYSIYH